MQDLSNLEFGQVEEQGKLVIKMSFWTPKANWVEIPLNGLVDFVCAMDTGDLENGEIGLHIQPYVYYYQTPLYITTFDVEDPGEHHRSIQANIDVAQRLFYQFGILGIDEDLVISLTGNGFRFTLPWVIPYRYTKAFLEMINDKPRFPGIDKGPQTGSNKFVRTLAYRGNTKQVKTAEDTHVHFLDNPGDILSLDERRYKELVAGRPDPENYAGVIPKIIPKGFPSEAFISILQEYDLAVKLKSTIAMPTPPKIRKNREVQWNRIYEFLLEIGTDHEAFEWENGEIIKLDTCPTCGESKGNPFITPYGTLKCFRSSCSAGQGEGLKPYQWVEGYEESTGEDTLYTGEIPSLTLEEARQKNKESIQQALETGDNICIFTSPGVGKTHEALIQAVPASFDRSTLYTAPTRQLANEAFEKIDAIVKSRDLDLNIMLLSGRDEENCNAIDDVNAAAAMGYTPAYIVCSRCDHKKDCLYQKQFPELQKMDIICTTHDVARCHENRINPDLWIIDENPLNQFFMIKTVPQSAMDKMRELESGDVSPLFEAIKKVGYEAASQLDEHQQARFYSMEKPPGKWEDAPILESISPEIEKFFENDLLPTGFSLYHRYDPDNEFSWEHSVHKQNLNLNAIRFWDTLAAREGSSLNYVSVTVSKDGTNINYTTTGLCIPRFEDCQIIHLDGTMYEPEVQAILPEFKIVDAQAGLSETKKIFVKSARGKTKMGRLSYTKKKADIEYLVSLLPEETEKVLFITHEIVKREVGNALDAIEKDFEFAIIHFWGPRGINEYEDFDACIAYGTPTVNAGGVEDHAMALFEDEEEMSQWKNSLGRRDLAQAIHRIRPVKGGKTIIIMGTIWPTEYLGYHDEQIDRMRKANNYSEALDRLKSFADQYGFMDKSIAMILGVATRSDKQALHDTHEMIIRGEGGSSEFAFTLIDTNKSECKFQGTPPSIYLADGKAWKKLIDDLHSATGLPYMQCKLKGPGKKSIALGTAERVRAFCELAGTRFDPDCYEPLSN